MSKFHLSPDSIAAIERVLARGDEVKISAWKDRIKVMSLRTKSEYMQISEKAVANPAKKE